MTAFGLGQNKGNGAERETHRPSLHDSMTWLAVRICQTDQPFHAQHRELKSHVPSLPSGTCKTKETWTKTQERRTHWPRLTPGSSNCPKRAPLWGLSRLTRANKSQGWVNDWIPPICVWLKIEQGIPLSPFLFNIVLGVGASAIWQEK